MLVYTHNIHVLYMTNMIPSLLISMIILINWSLISQEKGKRIYWRHQKIKRQNALFRALVAISTLLPLDCIWSISYSATMYYCTMHFVTIANTQLWCALCFKIYDLCFSIYVLCFKIYMICALKCIWFVLFNVMNACCISCQGVVNIWANYCTQWQKYRRVDDTSKGVFAYWRTWAKNVSHIWLFQISLYSCSSTCMILAT